MGSSLWRQGGPRHPSPNHPVWNGANWGRLGSQHLGGNVPFPLHQESFLIPGNCFCKGNEALRGFGLWARLTGQVISNFRLKFPTTFICVHGRARRGGRVAVRPHIVKDIAELLKGRLATRSLQGLGGQPRMKASAIWHWLRRLQPLIPVRHQLWSLLCQRSSPFLWITCLPLYNQRDQTKF